MHRTKEKAKCDTCSPDSDCNTCKHNYTSNYREMIPGPGHDIAPPQKMTPSEAHEMLKNKPTCTLCNKPTPYIFTCTKPTDDPTLKAICLKCVQEVGG